MKTKIRVLFLGKPKGGQNPTNYPFKENTEWPVYKGKFSSEAQSKFYAEKLKEFENDDIELTGKDLIRTEKELAAIAEDIKKEAGIVAFITGLCPSKLQKELISWGKPTIMVNPVESPLSPIPWFGNFSPMQGKTNVIPLLSSDFADVGRKIAVIKAIDKLKQTKLLHCHNKDLKAQKKHITRVIGIDGEKAYNRIRCHGGTAELTDEDIQRTREKFGLEIKPIPTEKLVKAYEVSDITEAKKLAKQWTNGAKEVIEPDRQDIVESCRLYIGIKKVLKEENAQAITESGLCMGTGPHPLPCLAFAQLNNEGLAGICQTDLSSAITQIMIGYLADRPGFMGHIHIDTAKNLIGISHDFSATKMDGRTGEGEPYFVRNHQGLYRSTCLNVKMKEGQKVTVAMLVPFDRMHVFTGFIEQNIDCHRDCRTSVAVKVKDAKKLLREWVSEDYPSAPVAHRVLFYGDWIEEIRDLGQILGFDVIDETE